MDQRTVRTSQNASIPRENLGAVPRSAWETARPNDTQYCTCGNLTDSRLDRKQEMEEYDAKLKAVHEEQAKYRKALELELKKLRTEASRLLICTVVRNLRSSMMRRKTKTRVYITAGTSGH